MAKQNKRKVKRDPLKTIKRRTTEYTPEQNKEWRDVNAKAQIKHDEKQNKSKGNYCDWKYILLAMLFYFGIIIFYDSEILNDYIFAVISIIWIFIIGWIIKQGYKCSK